MSKSDQERKELARVANCLIPVVDPSEEQLDSLKRECADLIDRKFDSEIIIEDHLSLMGRLRSLIGYLFSKNNKY